jgi:DNA polymerase-3 subunit delta
MMAPRRLVLATQCELVPESERSALLDYLADPSDRCVLVLTAMEFDRRTSFFRTLRSRAHLVEYPRIKGAALERWASEYLRSHGYGAPSSALKRLVEVVGTDLQALANEMDKLMVFAGAEGSITEAAVGELAGAMRQRGIFELTGALGRRDVRAALQVLASLLEAGEAPLMIVTMMARHYRQVLIAKEMLGGRRSPAEISEAAGIPPFVLDEFLRQAKSVDTGTARRLLTTLAEIDRRFKSTNADHRMVLEALICSI